MNDKGGIRIGIATVVIAIAMLAMVPNAAAIFYTEVGNVTYEGGSYVPDGWDVYVENLNQTYPGEPWHATTLVDVLPGFNYYVAGEYEYDTDYIHTWSESPDGKWFGESTARLCDMDQYLGLYILDIVVTEVIIPEEEYSKSLPSGWNLISLPLEPSDSSTSAVLGNDTIVYDAVQRYNANSHSWEDVMSGTMESGVGYFVHVTTAGTWTYSGTPYKTMSIDLQPGLNMIGSLNCTKSISNALSSIEGNYTYVARWNPALPDDCKYETNVTVAPNGFNDFADMERGTGYFVSVSAATTITLTEEC